MKIDLKMNQSSTRSVEIDAEKRTDQVLDRFKIILKNEPIQNLIGLK